MPLRSSTSLAVSAPDLLASEDTEPCLPSGGMICVPVRKPKAKGDDTAVIQQSLHGAAAAAPGRGAAAVEARAAGKGDAAAGQRRGK